MKEKKKVQKSNLLSKPLFLGLAAAAVAATSAGLFSVVIGLTPLRNDAASTHLPGSPESLTGLIPATLDHPVNILVLGIDNSGHPHQKNFTPAEALAGNSDTMLLVRLMPDSHTINVLSIPRDTLVKLPQTGIDKINDANIRGGPKLAASTVSHLLNGVAIDRYVRLDTEGFIHLVDALGGVEIEVPKKMDYVDRTQNLSIHFLPGRQKLSGQHLEEYIRFRHDALGDIGRVQRQQQVLKDILLTMLQPESLTKLPQILQVAKDNVDTDLSINEMLALAQALAKSDRRNFVLLPGRFSDKSEYRLSYWICDPKGTDKVLSRYFDINSVGINEQDKNLTGQQNLKIYLQNATKEPKAAAEIASLLQRRGFKNVLLSNADINTGANSTQKTKIIAQHGNPEAANAVKEVLGTGEVEVASLGDLASDVTVILGTDWVTSRHQQDFTTTKKQDFGLRTRQRREKIN